MRQWARRGTRPRQPADQRYENAYLFGAICPARGKGAALALPFVDTWAMQQHLDEISRHVAKGAHAVLILDRAGWHTTGNLAMPANITPIFLPSRAPELNPVENIWQYLRANWLSNSVFETYDAIIDAACEAWRSSQLNPKRSHRSGCANGRTSVMRHDRWYQSPAVQQIAGANEIAGSYELQRAARYPKRSHQAPASPPQAAPSRPATNAAAARATKELRHASSS